MTFCCGVGSFYRAAYRLGEQNYDLPFHLGLFFFFFKNVLLSILISTVADESFFFTFVCY